jgi:hypothetical protein
MPHYPSIDLLLDLLLGVYAHTSLPFCLPTWYTCYMQSHQPAFESQPTILHASDNDRLFEPTLLLQSYNQYSLSLCKPLFCCSVRPMDNNVNNNIEALQLRFSGSLVAKACLTHTSTLRIALATRNMLAYKPDIPSTSLPTIGTLTTLCLSEVYRQPSHDRSYELLLSTMQQRQPVGLSTEADNQQSTHCGYIYV